LFHPLGRLLVLLHIDVLVRDTETIQVSARPLRIPTPISPIDLNHPSVSSAKTLCMDCWIPPTAHRL
jgi:hypothetical protein